MKPYYQEGFVTQYCGDALRVLPELPGESVGLLATDPPYGISFMGKDWDKALPDKKIWAECIRVLKPGSFAFVMSIPRADCLSRMIISLEDAGFWVNFTPIFWAYASGFPKAYNIAKGAEGKLVLGTADWSRWNELGGTKQTQKTGYAKMQYEQGYRPNDYTEKERIDKVSYTTPQAKALDGSYGGFQPKPAVEVIIVAMKPLSEKTFVDQALKNGKGITWLDDCRVPYESGGDKSQATPQGRCTSGTDERIGAKPSMESIERQDFDRPPQLGRFPANLLVSDDVLNDGRISKSSPVGFKGVGWKHSGNTKDEMTPLDYQREFGDSGSFSRYFDLDKWAQKTFPFLIVPKASKGEKNRGCEDLTSTPKCPIDKMGGEKCTMKTGSGNVRNVYYKNNHPTVKPLKLMSYLITLGSREGDRVLDPFSGSGTTPLACSLLNRYCTAIEIEEKYCEIAARRCSQGVFDLSMGSKT